MKKWIFTIAAMLLFFAANAQDGRSIYNKYSDEKDVSAVFISPSMFKMIGKLPEITVDGNEKVDITPIVSTLKGFYMLSASDKGTINRLNNDVKRLLDSGSYELMIEAKEKGESFRIYTDGDDKIIRSLVMMATEGSEATFISMDGLINREALERLITSN